MKFEKVCILVFTLFVMCALAGCGSNNNDFRSWGTAKLIETGNAGDAIVPQISMDAAGNAVAVWFQTDGTRYSIWANHYTASTGTWNTATLISSNTAGDAQFPQISMNKAGNAIVVWHQYDGSTFSNIWSCRYTTATGTWTAPELIEFNDTGHAFIPRIAIDLFGNAIAVWYQADASNPPSIWSNRYSSSTGTWGTPTLIETDDAGYATDPVIAMDKSGNAMAVWQQSDGTRYNIWSNRFTASTGTWGTATLLETDNAGNALYPQIAIDAFGNAMTVWFQYDGTRDNIYSNRYIASTGTWGTPTLVETDNTGGAEYPKVAIDISGNAVAVWQQSDGTRFNIWSNRFTASTGTWGTATLIETDNAGDAVNPRVAVDGAGNVVVVWNQNDGTQSRIYSNRYVVSVGTWGTAKPIDTKNLGDAFIPNVVMDSPGNAVVVWNQFDGPFFSIWSNVYR